MSNEDDKKAAMLRQWMATHGYTIEQASKALCVSRHTVTSWLRPTHNVARREMPDAYVQLIGLSQALPNLTQRAQWAASSARRALMVAETALAQCPDRSAGSAMTTVREALAAFPR